MVIFMRRIIIILILLILITLTQHEVTLRTHSKAPNSPKENMVKTFVAEGLTKKRNIIPKAKIFSGQGTITGTPPPSSGDWIINDTTIVKDVTLIINGSIIVQDNGALVLINTEVYMNLTYDGEHKIKVYGNLTILNSKITSYNTSNNYFIKVFDGAKLRIENSEISYAGYTGYDASGLWIQADNVTIKNTTIHHNVVGIYLDGSNGNTIVGNRIFHILSSIGMELYRSSNNIITDNEFTNCGLYLFYSYNNIVRNNTVNDKPLIYLENTANKTVENAGQIILISCNNITVRNNDLTNISNAIELWDSYNIIIEKNNITDNNYGIMLYNSNDNVIVNNRLINNYAAIFMNLANNTTIMYNSIINNTIGIEIELCKSNVIYYNDFLHNNEGIFLQYATSNIIFYNNITDNNYGVCLFFSRDNIVILNSFFNSSVNTFDNNTWFTPKPVAYKYLGIYYIGQLGNYWDSYSGNDTNDDYIGDIPYNGDMRPLVEPSYNYIIEDYDLDGLWDIYEITKFGSDPLKTDTDGDMLPDGWEVTYGLNPTNSSDASLDADGDRLTNLEEYQHGTDPTQPDTDGDGMPDGWEAAYRLDPHQNDASQDMDGDSLTNLEEYQYGTNPVLADTDGDGMPDGWEATYGLNPTNSSDASLDVDDDGLSNVFEFFYGIDPTNPDSDGDGYEDGLEVFQGTDPLDRNDYPAELSTGSQGASSEVASSSQNIIWVYNLVLVILGASTIISVGALLFVLKRRGVQVQT